jgi:hypothetical protein
MWVPQRERMAEAQFRTFFFKAEFTVARVAPGILLPMVIEG